MSEITSFTGEKKAKKVKLEEGGTAWEVHERLLNRGARVWGVVSSPSETEIYYYEDEENETNIVAIVKSMQREVAKI